jgi:hypothetical protein
MAVWRNTHRDFRGVVGGTRTVLVNRGAEGTCLVPLTALTEEEVEMKLPKELRKEGGAQ